MKSLTLAFGLWVLFGCNSGIFTLRHSDANTDGAELPRSTGCLAGVVENGATGQRLDLTAEGMVDNFFVLQGSSQRYASPLLAGGEAGDYPNLVGEYTLCGIPVEADLPLYAAVPGFQTFESAILIPSSSAAKGDGAAQDILSQTPTLQANIRLFPATAVGKNYQVIVSFNGAALPGASVQLIPTGGYTTSIVVPLNNYLLPVTTGYKTLVGQTDASGIAMFNAADLALGAVYNYVVLPVDASLQTARAGTVSVGYVDAGRDPYVLHVDLAQVNSDLVVVSRSTDSQHYSENGSIAFVFNRPIELVPETLDGVRATLQNALVAALPDDISGNSLSEQVDVTIVGQVLTLKPKFKTNPDKTKEMALAISYTGIHVRPTEGQKLLHQLEITNSVVFYGGQNAAVPTTLSAYSGNNQTADPSTELDDPLRVLVLDGNNEPMANQTVTFTVTSGGGSVTTSATTNAEGLALATWTLGPSGAQTATATLGDLTATFEASFTIAQLELLAGNTQTGLATGPLPLALKLTAYDSTHALVRDAEVTFIVASPGGGKVKKVGVPGTGNATVKVLTDSNGIAQVTWLMGSAAGTGFIVAASAGTASDLQFTADAVVATLTLTSGNSQTANHETEVTAPLVVTVTNTVGGAAISDVKVRFTTTDTGGLLGVSGAEDSDTVDVLTDASGQAQLYWKLGTATGTQHVTVAILDTPGPGAKTFSATAN